MRTTDNHVILEAEKSLHPDPASHDAGLSSAMHDIRSLATSYDEHRQESAAANDQRSMVNSTFDRRVLLIPQPKDPADRFKILMLSMMVLVGLSTSAIALRMALAPMNASGTQTQSEFMPNEVEPANVMPPSRLVVEPSDEIRPELVLSPDAGSYTVPTSPESSQVNPERRDRVTPVVRKKRSSQISSQARAKKSEERKVAAPDSYDEVACLLGDRDACSGAETEDDEDLAEDELEGRPYRLSRSEVMQPMQSVRGRVRTCADDHDYEGVALVKIVIAPNGRVEDFDLDDGVQGFQSCVEKHVSSLRFPLLKQSFTVSYPYTLR